MGQIALNQSDWRTSKSTIFPEQVNLFIFLLSLFFLSLFIVDLNYYILS